MSRIGIIGAGPSGVMAAIFAAKHHQVTLFEKDDVLKTILLTGGGRCNLAYNETDIKELAKFYPRGEKFLYSVFSKFSTKDTIEFFDNMGVKTYVQPDSRIFPVTNSSKTVKKALSDRLKNVRVINEKVLSVKIQNGIFKVKTLKSEYDFDAVILAAGSKGGGYKIAESLGHKIVEPRPSLTALKTREKELFCLSGMTIQNIRADVYFENKKKKTVYGDILFTHFGISGPLAYKISSYCAYDEFNIKNPLKIVLNFVNEPDTKEFEKKLSEKFNKETKKDILNTIGSYVPRNFAKILLEQNNIDIHTKSGQIKKEARQIIAKNLTAFTLHASDRCTGEEIVTAGGADLKEINSKTMESKLISGLYFCGEILDIDGLTGGFNLQNCWSTGFIAGSSV